MLSFAPFRFSSASLYSTFFSSCSLDSTQLHSASLQLCLCITRLDSALFRFTQIHSNPFQFQFTLLDIAALRFTVIHSALLRCSSPLLGCASIFSTSLRSTSVPLCLTQFRSTFISSTTVETRNVIAPFRPASLCSALLCSAPLGALAFCF